RKIAVVFVLFIGFFYTMPQMKGAGTALSYIFQGLPYPVGVVLVGAVITLNVALGGMKGITLVQAFQYWAKMFAISVPIFVLMAVYGDYGSHVSASNIQTFEGEVIFDGKTNVIKEIAGMDRSARTLLRGDELAALQRVALPQKAPRDETWLNPFGPLTTKAAKIAAAALTNRV